MSVDAQPDGVPSPGQPGRYDSPATVSAQPRPRGWAGKLLRVCFAIFALEIGLFLVVFPWMDFWQFNYFQGLNPILESVWDHPYFRGALTGLGLVNVYIAFLEVIRLLLPKRTG